MCVVVIVEVTEADYQRREGSEDFIQARISYDRDLVNPITIIFHPVTYDTYEAEVGSLPIGFPSREFEASGEHFMNYFHFANCISCVITI